MKKISLLVGILIIFLFCGIVSAETGGAGMDRPAEPSAMAQRAVSVPDQVCTTGCCDILWDISHRESGSDGFDKYPELVSDLLARGYTVTTSSDGVDTPGLLAQYDVLVINAGSTAGYAYTASEADAIEAFVNNGGGLLVLDEWAGFHQANLEPVVTRFGTSASGSIEEWDYTTGVDPAQPVFSGVSSLYFAYMGPLSAQSPSKAAAWYGEAALVNVVEGKKVIIIGDGNLFQSSSDPDWDFIDKADNRKFAANVFTYLCQSGGTPTPEFPSMVLPVTFIIGFLGIILLVRKTREH